MRWPILNWFICCFFIFCCISLSHFLLDFSPSRAISSSISSDEHFRHNHTHTMARMVKVPKIYFFGDSLTQLSFGEGRWASIIADEFQRKADIIARGFFGYNSRQYKALLPYLENDMKGASIAGIFLGTNDANDPALNPRLAVPVKEYKENLISMVNSLKQFSDIKTIFLVTPPPIDEKKFRRKVRGGKTVYFRSLSLVAEYAAACKEAAKEVNVPCIDLFSPMSRLANIPDMFSDGVHFSTKGAEFVASEMLPKLKSFMAKDNLLPGGATWKQNVIMPLRDVSNVDPDSSFQNWFKKHQ